MVKYVYIRVISLSNWAAKIWLYGGGNVAFKVVLVDDDLLVLQDLETLADWGKYCSDLYERGGSIAGNQRDKTGFYCNRYSYAYYGWAAVC